MKRDLVTIDDLSNEEIEGLFDLADGYVADLRGQTRVAPGFVLASLFFEPSTRTRLSFEVAMMRLGGSCVTSASREDSSLSKGESLTDTIKVVGSYADAIVIRHPVEGSARLASVMTKVPVVNAGDGGHEHPTQTLCDLYTLWKEKGRIAGLSVAICGDLKHGRTVHSLSYALARFGAHIVSVPRHGLELPDYVVDKLRTEYGSRPERVEAQPTRSFLEGLDAVYITPQKSHQLTLFTDPGATNAEILPKIPKIDALYVTRTQRERFDQGDSPDRHDLVLDSEVLRDERLREAVVMHPLPRVDEIDSAVDADPRAAYFRQAERGVPIRMALLSFLLGLRGLSPPASPGSPVKRRGRAKAGGSGAAPRRPAIYRSAAGLKCPNARCISRVEERFVVPEFVVKSRDPIELRCLFCERIVRPAFVAEGGGTVFLPAGSPEARVIATENLVAYESAEQAERAGKVRTP